VAYGNLTDPNTESVYSGVVSLPGNRLISFLSQLNELELWDTDVGKVLPKKSYTLLVILSLLT
jgi:hypothetical protein